MKKRYAAILLVLLSITNRLIAQTYTVTGTIRDANDNSTLIGVNVFIAPVSDTSAKNGTVTDVDGAFAITNVAPGQYTLRATYIGFQPLTRTINVTGDLDLGAINLRTLSTTLQNVTVTGQQIRAQQSGDTTNFNAGAFKTNPDANAEDLINKMPGISTEGGTVKANGEDVKRILVDGKPFFGDDPNAAIRNLPAEVIDRIQVFDRLSDQAQLTGFNDGNEERTINIITRPGRNTGQFGKLFGGIGMLDQNNSGLLYQLGGNLNFFSGNRRVSLIALSNNINQQNFSTEDLVGVVNQRSGQGNTGRGGGNFGGGGPRGGGGTRGGGGFQGGGDRGDRGGSNAGNFLIGQQEGITTTHSFGLNYTDQWAKNLEVTGSYFFNATENDNVTNLTRNLLRGEDSNTVYREFSTTRTKNMNHRANLRMEYKIDSFNTLIFTPRLSLQQNEQRRNLNGSTREPDSMLINSTDNTNISENNGLNAGANLVYNRRFAKRGRGLSVSLNSNINSRDGDGSLYSQETSRNVNDTGFSNRIRDQRWELESRTINHSGNLTYTEPLNERSQLMLNYNPSRSNSRSDRQTRVKDGNGEYSLLDTAQSNRFDNIYATQRGGLTYRYNDEKFMLNAGASIQAATLEGMQEFPYPFTLRKTFTNVLPSLMANYRFTRTQNLRLMYRTSTNAPGIQQLQNVYDITNPLFVRTGNPDLNQDFQHTLMLRYGNTNTARSTNFFVMAFANFTEDYIGNATYYFDRDSTVAEGIVINRGAQLTVPVNLDGYRSARTFATYGMPLRQLKSNLNMNLGFNYNRIPAIINGLTNLANNYTINGGLVLSSNISEAVDFTVSYSGYYNVVRNSIQTQSNNNYYNHNTSVRFNWLHRQRIVVNTTINHTQYSGLYEGFNQSFLLWNAALGYKFLKDRSLDIRISAYDILNQNRAINRTVTETYIEDSYTNVLQRYFMVNLTYTLRRFGGAGTGARTNEAAEPSMPPAPERSGRRTGEGQ